MQQLFSRQQALDITIDFQESKIKIKREREREREREKGNGKAIERKIIIIKWTI